MSEFIDIVLEGPVYMELVVAEEVHVDVQVPLQQELEFQTLSDWQEPYNYIGRAFTDKAQDEAAWTITRIEVAADGTVTELTASNVKWSERTTVIYS